MQTIKNISKNFGKEKILYILSFVFIAVNTLFISEENFYFLLIPFVLLIIYLTIIKPDKILMLIVLASPLSILLHEYVRGLSFNISLPTEPLLILIMFIFLLKIITGEFADRKILLHPVSLAIYFNLFWIFFTSISSTMPLVSFKYLISRLWFVIPLYFFAAHIFKNINNIKNYAVLYIFGLTIVIIYTISRHLTFGLFDKQAAHFVMSPFYKDHTSYGAALAMYLPFLVGFFFLKTKKALKIVLMFLLPLFLAGITLSYTRAAWISVFAISGLLFVFLAKIKIRYLIFFGIIGGLFFFFFQFEITDKMKKNKKESSEQIEDHLSSISNIATDASNLERINRWNSAFRMFNEKPVLGFGPGTYSFIYAGYQRSQDRTIISTNFGDKGNAHSEYIGALCESGILGTLSYILILITCSYTAINIIYKTKNKEIKILTLTAYLSLFTYYIHGFLNNFSDTDKISVPFWGFTAVIVALDVFYFQKENDKVQ